ncbi:MULTISPECIES: hypothetical protein [Streptomyces]|uniref:Uncharacterized protein n=1 Tax=Streptomyces venezuelae (strain ATCC 10712 / CBS 650.69 / DSM 40230 / JCM 4526 / NBRC 13096 / PD 04745) TaxID=953739 RepID=F2R8X7_STRVP|nr:hypothetical protein [Streptomyces venezuelae]APE22283.1 hypothetical protein vnz_15495 [Streptomyces venezuelae]QER99665.1 hypothetical protein DEJ43_15690 [Streptomyces venezuelae ATCC 10712]QES06684.1 hypothetical protein DEJ44_14390 [Streptomyces venezuelae]CCA56437.1 hypothetical protein SVEN_3151 [Streptomyces venezuelae ATCC 10712]
MSLPGQFSDPRVLTLFGLLAVSTVVWLSLGLRARTRRERAHAPLERVWHPQESVPLTPAEEHAFGQVVSRLSQGSPGRLR